MASVASHLIEEVAAHAQSGSLEDAREICADGTYFPINLRSTAWVATEDILVQALCMLAKTDTHTHTHTHTSRLSIAKMVTWSRLSVPLTLPVFCNGNYGKEGRNRHATLSFIPSKYLYFLLLAGFSATVKMECWVFSGTLFSVHRIKNHQIRKNRNLSIHCRRRLGSLKISYISFPLPLGLQIANTGVFLLKYCLHFLLPMSVIFPTCYTTFGLLNQLFEEMANFVRCLSLTN